MRAMTSSELIYDYGWAIAVALVGLFLLSRYIMRRLHARRLAREKLAAESGEAQLLSPDGYRRARRQFLLTLALLIVIIVVSILTHIR